MMPGGGVSGLYFGAPAGALLRRRPDRAATRSRTTPARKGVAARRGRSAGSGRTSATTPRCVTAEAGRQRPVGGTRSGAVIAGYPGGRGAPRRSLAFRPMRTTLKRGVGRARPRTATVARSCRPAVADRRLADHALPAAAALPARRARARSCAGSPGSSLCGGLAAGLAGGAYLYIDEDVIGAVQPREREVQRGGEEARHRRAATSRRSRSSSATTSAPSGRGASRTARSDTVMLVRADPKPKPLSMLSFPRDLLVDIRCPGKAGRSRDRINAAYSRVRRRRARSRPCARSPGCRSTT